MPRTTTDAITWGRTWINSAQKAPTPDGSWHRWCLIFVRSCYDVAAQHPSAGAAWDNAARRHRTSNPADIPAGVPVFWELPSPADHVALSTSGGLCLSNDIRRPGKIDEVPIDEITRRWGGQLLGWTEDLNGVTVWTPPPPPVWTRGTLVDRLIARTRAAARRTNPGRRRMALRRSLRELLTAPRHQK